MIYDLADSGREKRYKKAVASGDEKVKEVIAIAEKYLFPYGYKTSEYKQYDTFKNKILKDTQNYKEKAIVFNNKNEIVLEKLGVATSVSFSSSELSKMKGHKLIHNHPSGATFSFEDIMIAVQNGLKEIVAFTGKGTYYRLIIKNNIDVKDIVLKYNQAKKEASEVTYKLFEDGIFTEQQSGLEYHHFTMSLFANSLKGVIYEKTKH